MEPGVVIGLAIGGAFLLEGAMWALFPGVVRRMYQQVLGDGDDMLQKVGLTSFLIGALIMVLALKAAGG